MRKLIALGSSVVLCVALAACGGDDDDDDAGGGGGGGAEFCEQVRGFDEEFAEAEATDEEGDRARCANSPTTRRQRSPTTSTTCSTSSIGYKRPATIPRRSPSSPRKPRAWKSRRSG